MITQLLGMPILDMQQAKFFQLVASYEVSCLQELFVELEHNQGAVKCQVREKTEEYRKLLDEQYERIFSLL